MTKSRLIYSGITHAAALLVGWGGWTAFRHFTTKEAELTAGDAKAREERVGGTRSKEDMLAGFAAKAAAKAAAAEFHDWPRMDERLADEFAQAIATTAHSGDFETVLAAEMAKMKDGETPSMKMGTLLYFWALEDPFALLDWRGYEDGPRGKVLWFYEEEIFRKLIAEKGLAALAPIFKHEPGGDFTVRTVARVFAKSADIRGLASLKQMSGKGWVRVRSEEMGQLWPWAERAKLVNFAVSEGDVEMIGHLAKSDAAKASGTGAWLLELLRNASLDPGFRELLAKDDILEEIAHADRKLLLEDRLALLNGGNPNSRPNQAAYDDLAWRDLTQILDHVRDWDYDFRHGAVDANEVLFGVSEELPELAAQSPGTLRKWIFRHLIEEDPSRAMRLLDHLPSLEKAKTVLATAKRQFYQTDPNLLLAALQQVPADDPQFRDARLEVWVQKTNSNYQDHDGSYVDWVKALPAGVDREMALYAVAAAAAESDPQLAADLRGEMKDEALKRKIADAE